MEEAFAATALKAKMVDVYIIPDYKGFLSVCIDSKLSHLHKEGQTHHQWRFEAVEICPDFPLGAEWSVWESIWAPRTDNALDYLQQMRQNGKPYHIPLREFLLSRAVVNIPGNCSCSLDRYREINPDFQWPEIIAAAMNSVLSAFNPVP
jgi:hypothetical protein